MPVVTHPHPYLASPPLESLSAPVLRTYHEGVAGATKPTGMHTRLDIETELALSSTLSSAERSRYRSLAWSTDEALGSSEGYDVSRVNASVGRVFLPLVLQQGKDMDTRWRHVYARAKKLLDACEEESGGQKHGPAIGIAAELLFNLGMRSRYSVAVPTLAREDHGFRHDGKKYCWDSTVVSTGGNLPKGRYRAQVKLSEDSSVTYHPDIVIVTANPRDGYHVSSGKFIDFVRLALPGTVASHQELDRYDGRVRTFREALKAHGPSLEAKVTDRCLAEAA